MLESNDEYIAISEVSRYIPGRPSRSTVWRWMLNGVRGHRLASVHVGGRRFVTKAAIKAWLKAINEADTTSLDDCVEHRLRSAHAALQALRRKGC